MSDGDKIVLDESLSEQDTRVPFQSKQYLEITDNNSTNGVFNGSITFDLTNLSSLYQHANLSEAYVEFPVRFGIRNPTASTQTPAAFGTISAMTPKGGWHSFVNSVNINIGSTNVQSSNIYQNLNTSFKMLTTWSRDEFEKNKANLGLAVDDFLYDVHDDIANSVIGIENTTATTLFKNKVGFKGINEQKYNHAFEERAYNINTDATGSSMRNVLLGSSKDALGLNSCQSGISAIAGEYLYVCYAVAQVRLKDISDVISKLPLMKGIKGQITINYNSAVASVISDTSGVITGATFSPTYGNCMPCMTDLVPNATVANTWDIICEVSGARFNSNVLTTATPSISGAKLFVPLYVGQPSVERALNQKKSVKYLERFQTTIEVNPNGSYSGSISSGIVNPKRITLYPFYTTTESMPIALEDVVLPSDPMLSPYTHEGFGCSPLAHLRGLQFIIGGKPVFQSPSDYSFHQFNEEIVKMGLDSGLNTQQSSGLIDFRQWRQLYSFYTCDLSRKIDGSNGQSVPVQVQLTNATSLKMRIVAEIEYEKEIVVDTQYGIIQSA